MEKFSEIKKVYCIFSDEETRGYFASVKRLVKDCSDAEAAQKAEAAEAALKVANDALKAAKKRAADLQRAAAKNAEKQPEAQKAEAEAQKAAEAAAEAKKAAEAAQKAAEEVQKRCNANTKAGKALQSLAEVMQRKQFGSADINKDFLLTWLPELFNDAQQLCSVKAVKPEEEAAAKEAYKDTPDMLKEKEGILYIYKPRNLFTANGFLTLFCKAADARQKEGKAKLSAAEKEAKKADDAKKEAARIAAYREKIAAYEAKMQKAAEASK